MTSIETMTIHTLPEACEIAGVGGTVIRNSITYEVGRVGDTFGLRLAGESASTFTAIGGSWAQEGWTVVTRGDTAQTVREFFGGLASGTHVVRDKDDLSDKKRPTIRDHLTWHLLIHKVRFQWLF